ncbi:MAG: thioredoxin [Candidatus Micrarchaeia archaeon]
MVVEVTGRNFEKEVLQAKTPVLVDFWAAWCGPCRMLAPTIEELAKEYEGSIKFAKVNVDEESELAARYAVMSIPTLILFKDGKPVDSSVGARPKAALKAWLDSKLK